MSEDYHSLLVQHCLPNLIKLLSTEKPQNDLEVAPDVQLRHLHLGPAFSNALAELAVSCVDEGIVVEFVEEGLGGGGESEFEVAEERECRNDGDGFLEVGAFDFVIFAHHFLSGLDLLEVAHSEEHPLLALPQRLKVEEVVVLHLIVRTVRHRVVHHQVLDLLDRLAHRETVLHLHAPRVVEVYDKHAQHRLLRLVVAFLVLVHHLLHQQSSALQLAVASRQKCLHGSRGESVVRSRRICF